MDETSYRQAPDLTLVENAKLALHELLRLADAAHPARTDDVDVTVDLLDVRCVAEQLLQILFEVKAGDATVQRQRSVDEFNLDVAKNESMTALSQFLLYDLQHLVVVSAVLLAGRFLIDDHF